MAIQPLRRSILLMVLLFAAFLANGCSQQPASTAEKLLGQWEEIGISATYTHNRSEISVNPMDVVYTFHHDGAAEQVKPIGNLSYQYKLDDNYLLLSRPDGVVETMEIMEIGTNDMIWKNDMNVFTHLRRKAKRH